MNTWIALLLYTHMASCADEPKLNSDTCDYLYTKEELESRECCICIDEILLEGVIKPKTTMLLPEYLLRCPNAYQHVFHKKCLLGCFAVKKECPTCRYDCTNMDEEILSKIADKMVMHVISLMKDNTKEICIKSDPDYKYMVFPAIIMLKKNS